MPVALGYLVYGGSVWWKQCGSEMLQPGNFRVTIGTVLSKGQPVEQDR